MANVPLIDQQMLFFGKLEGYPPVSEEQMPAHSPIRAWVLFPA